MDPIADMLSTIKNAQMVGKARVELPYSKMKEVLARLLEEEKYLSGVAIFKPQGSSFKMLSLDLKYFDGSPFISHIKRISKPGKRVYAGKAGLPRVLGGRGVVVVSTSRGLMSAKEASKKDLGGEVICEVW